MWLGEVNYLFYCFDNLKQLNVPMRSKGDDTFYTGKINDMKITLN